MADIRTYLDWVNYAGTPSVSAQTLFGLHQAHAFAFPFENLDVINGVPIRLDQERFFDKMVGTRRGGICFEMNGLFKLVLDSLGFESWFIACQVYFPPDYQVGPERGHVAIVTRLGAELYLVDVGFGSGFIHPLRLEEAGPQFQVSTWYRFSPLEGEEVLLERSADGQAYTPMYRFSLAPRVLSDFAHACHYHQTSPEAPFTRQPLCSRPTPEGRITLTGSSLVITKNGQRQEEPIASEAAFTEKLAQYFGLRQQAGAVVRVS